MYIYIYVYNTDFVAESNEATPLSALSAYLVHLPFLHSQRQDGSHQKSPYGAGENHIFQLEAHMWMTHMFEGIVRVVQVQTNLSAVMVPLNIHWRSTHSPLLIKFADWPNSNQKNDPKNSLGPSGIILQPTAQTAKN